MKKITALLLSALMLTNITACNVVPENEIEEPVGGVVDNITPPITNENTDRENVENSVTNNSTSILIDENIKIAEEIRDRLFHSSAYGTSSSLNHVSEPFRSILMDEKTFYSVRYQKEMFLADYTCSYARKKVSECQNVSYTLVDMDGDGYVEMILSVESNDMILHHNQMDGIVYAYDDFCKTIPFIGADGIFSWYEFTNALDGVSSISYFTSEGYCETDIWRVENAGTDDIKCYINEVEVSLDELLEYDDQIVYQSPVWYSLDRYPLQSSETDRAAKTWYHDWGYLYISYLDDRMLECEIYMYQTTSLYLSTTLINGNFVFVDEFGRVSGIIVFNDDGVCVTFEEVYRPVTFITKGTIMQFTTEAPLQGEPDPYPNEEYPNGK